MDGHRLLKTRGINLFEYRFVQQICAGLIGAWRCFFLMIRILANRLARMHKTAVGKKSSRIDVLAMDVRLYKISLG